MTGQEWIKAALKARGHKLKDVAETLKITPPRLSDILKGAREVQADEILPLADLLGLSPTRLLKSLSARQLIDFDTPENAPVQLPILGQITGTGLLLALPEDLPFKTVSLPPDAQTHEGLSCYVMGDDSLATDIQQGSLLIAADPKKHFFPIVPGAILLARTGPNQLIARQYHQTPDGRDWLVPRPITPNPAYLSYSFDIQPKWGKAISDPSTLSIADIEAAVLWVHRRYTPKV